MKELLVVMPVYNEGALVENVLESWLGVLRNLKIDFLICAYNDGSTDDSLERLRHIATHNRNVTVIDKANTGHGPTILVGYREAQSQWVLQIDSDDEIRATEFVKIWTQRDKADLILGLRMKGKAVMSRRLLSWGARTAVRFFYRSDIFDVNSCFRLYRAETFQKAFHALPINTFAPNVILTGYAALSGLRLLEIPVVFRARAGLSSIRSFKIIRIAAVAFLQTLRARFALRRM